MAIKTLLSIDIGISRVFRIQNGSIYFRNKSNLITRVQAMMCGLVPNTFLEVIIAPQYTYVRSDTLQDAFLVSKICPKG